MTDGGVSPLASKTIASFADLTRTKVSNVVSMKIDTTKDTLAVVPIKKRGWG